MTEAATTTPTPKPPEIYNIPVVQPSQLANNINLLLWGPSGAGKTTLASTFPGRKLWLQFDPQGVSSLKDSTDIVVLDLSGQEYSIVQKFKEPDPLNLSRFITEHNINSIIVDSLTAFQEMALHYGVSHARGFKQHAAATIEDPGYGGYGRRKTWTMQLVMNILSLGRRLGIHTCFISHEDSPTKDDKGAVVAIEMMLGSDLPDKTGLQMGEIWNLVDTGHERRIMVRPARLKKPIKTRMFLADSAEFDWKYNQDKPDPKHTVAAWYDLWRENKFQKIPLPR